MKILLLTLLLAGCGQETKNDDGGTPVKQPDDNSLSLTVPIPVPPDPVPPVVVPPPPVVIDVDCEEEARHEWRHHRSEHRRLKICWEHNYDRYCIGDNNEQGEHNHED